MIRTKNELLAYLEGYGDAYSTFIDVLNIYGGGVPAKCLHEMQRAVRMLNKAICRFTPTEKEDKPE